MTAFEPVVLAWRPDTVLVVGDVNAALACALVANKLGVQVAHVKARLRSFDLGIPCLTLRTTTERPVTISEGTNRLVGTEPEAIVAGWRAVSSSERHGRVPPLWDGGAARRIVQILLHHSCEMQTPATVPGAH